ncbi:MAG: glutathione S-transferase family protein, partial [Hyphomicrobiales bacterium]
MRFDTYNRVKDQSGDNRDQEVVEHQLVRAGQPPCFLSLGSHGLLGLRIGLKRSKFIMLKVLGKTSSINVRKVLWACDELQLSYEVEEWGEGFGNTETEHYQALNPNGLVPTLIDGDFVLWESNTIIRYFAGEYGSGELLPRDSKSRALVEKWMDWQATEFNNSWRYAFQALVRKNPDFSNKNEIEASLGVWARHIGILDDQLVHTGGHVADAEFTLADIP